MHWHGAHRWSINRKKLVSSMYSTMKMLFKLWKKSKFNWNSACFVRMGFLFSRYTWLDASNSLEVNKTNKIFIFSFLSINNASKIKGTELSLYTYFFYNINKIKREHLFDNFNCFDYWELWKKILKKIEGKAAERGSENVVISFVSLIQHIIIIRF